MTMKEIIEKNLKVMRKHGENLEKERLKIEHTYDKYLLTFSTGGLYLSVFFTNNLGTLNHKEILGIGWLSLIAVVTSTMLSFIFSDLAFEKEIEHNNEDINELVNNRKITESNEQNKYTKYIIFLQRVTLISFVLGIILLSVFYLINIGSENSSFSTKTTHIQLNQYRPKYKHEYQPKGGR